MSIAYYNGKISSPKNIEVPLTDRCVFFGDGVYDAAIGRGGKIYLLEEHTERLLRGAKALGIPCPYSKEELETLLLSLAKGSGEDVYTVYFQLSRNKDSRLHSARNIDGANLLITVTECRTPNPYERISLVSYPDKRYLYCNVKTLNLLPSVLASTYADERGCDEAVFIRNGVVTECAHSNISIIRDGVLFTHPECERILSGITRRHLIDTARKMGIEVREEAFTKADLYAANEVIVTSSTKLSRLAEAVDGIKYERHTDSLGLALSKALFNSFVENV